MPSKSIERRQATKRPNAEAFESYHGSGWQLIPLHRWDSRSTDKRGKVRDDGKRPRDSDWTRRDYDESKVIARCIGENRNAGVRLTACQLVIDVDPRRDGADGFANLCRDLKLDPHEWPRVETGSGGSHYYMTLPEGVRVLDTLAHVSDVVGEPPRYSGVEFKSAGRQVVGAGSIHPNGNPYEWDWLAPSLADAPEAPAVLVDAIRRPERTGEAIEGGQYDCEQAAAMLDSLDVTDFRDHDKWLRNMMACHHATGGEARGEFIEWSTQDPNYADQAEVIGRRWDSLHADTKGERVTYKTFRKFVQDEGDPNTIPAEDASGDFDPVEDEGDDWLEGGELVRVEERGLKLNRANVAPDTYENALSAVQRAGLLPAWDELKQNVVFRADVLPWAEDFGRLLTDHTARLIRVYFVNQFQGVAYSPGKDNLIEALMTVAYARKFNPVLEYLDSLQWDGTERLPLLFGRYFNCGVDDYTRGVSLAFGVGAVRRMRSPGCKFDTMPILRSPQGWNKSTAVRVLFGSAWYSDADLGSLRDKDAALKLRGVWVQEFAEIESLTRAETGTLKAFCSRATDRQRDPYGRVVEDAPRRLVFVATVNEGGYLKDATGGRRFWPLEVGERIDVARLAVDRDQLWAEAAAREAQGEPDTLAPSLWPIAAERQEEQTSGDPWADTLRDFLGQRVRDFKAWGERDRESDDPDDVKPPPPGRVHTGDLFDSLGILPADQTRDKAQRLRTVMEAGLGWRHSKSVRVLDRIGAGYVRRA